MTTSCNRSAHQFYLTLVLLNLPVSKLPALNRPIMSSADPTAPCYGWLSKTGRTWSREVKRFYWIDAKSAKMLYSKSEVGPDVTSGRAQPPHGLEVREINLAQSAVCCDASPSLKISIESLGKTHILQAPNAADQQRWFKSLRATCLGASIANVYNITKDLGSGAFSVVKLAEDKNSKEMVAIKCVDRKKLSPEDLTMLRREVQILSSLDHPNIIKFKEYTENPSHCYLVMEPLMGGELFDRIISMPEGHFSEKVAVSFFMPLMSALAHLHAMHIAHLDLKPENFLLASAAFDATIKIADFGFADYQKPGTVLHEVCGSPGYIAPEIISERVAIDGYTLAADIWSMGVILYILLTGFPPFAAESDDESFDLTKRGQYDRAPMESLTPSAQNLLTRMLVLDPSQRLTAAEVLRHPWISGEASSVALTQTQSNLKKLLARKQWKKAIHGVKFTAKLSAMMKSAKKTSVGSVSSGDEATAS
jgi:serine/threonine protein kinase